ncbi:hypothetical protein CC86DRAFT_294260, partial [Ophiobolus disseminans]
IDSLQTPSAYTLVFDGNPIPARTAEVFVIVQRVAALQSALDRSYGLGVPSPSCFDRRFCKGYIYEGFPQAVQDIFDRTSAIQCNFDLHTSPTPEEVLEKQKGQSLQAWEKAWARHEPSKFQTAPPLPPWHLFRWRRALPW